MPSKIDTHLHLLYPEQLDYPWIDSVPPLQQPFPLEKYTADAKAAGVTEAIFMEVDVAPRQALDEVNLVRELATTSELPISGIIAAARPEDEDFAARLDALAGTLVKGIRRVLHTQDDALSTSTHFRQNVGALPRWDFTFDLCVLARQLPLAIQLADACPQTQFILDHCGVPDIAGGDFDSWKLEIQKLAKRQNVACKISGLPTYCPPDQVSPETLRPWVETCIEAFGWQRVVWGGDWPVCEINSDLPTWSRHLDTILSAASSSEQEALYITNARQLYRL